MTAMGHSFRTEIESRSLGNPTFLSRHLDALCPPTQEEDDWLEQELERARQQRGSFYRKMASSRSASMRDLDDVAGSRHHSASRGSTERELSGSPTGSTSSPPVPEPHSSWRFYTSYDNGEWKRHCVPAQKEEEEISIKSPTSDKEKEISPAYESHLKKYRQARNALFDRPARKFAASNSPQGETTTVRVVSHGNPGDLRSALGGSTNRLPFGGSTPDIRFRTIREPAMSNATSLPTQYRDGNNITTRQETTTSETITTMHGPEITEPAKPVEKPASVHTSPTRPRHNNMGFKEKIIIPTKYKSESEKTEAALKKQELAAKAEKEKVAHHKPAAGGRPGFEPNFQGSTFEKFDYKGMPLIKPTFSEYNSNSSSKRKPMFGDSLGENSTNGAKRRPLDSSSQPMIPSNISTGSNDMLYSSWPAFQSSTPVTVETKAYSSTEKRSLPFGSPVERTISVRVSSAPTIEKPIPQFEKPTSAIQPPEENNNITLGAENSAFSVPNKNRQQTEPSKTSSGEKIIYSRVHQNAAKSPEPKPKETGAVSIPVVRVQGSAQDVDRGSGSVSDTTLNVATDPLTGCAILELLEDTGGGEQSGKIHEENKSSTDRTGNGMSVARTFEIDDRDLNNNSSAVRISSTRNVTNENSFNDKENQKVNVNGSTGERILMPTNKRVLPVFSSDSGGPRRNPLSSSTLHNLLSKSEERIFKPGERTSSGEKIIIPSKYRQGTNGKATLSSNGISKSTTDVSWSGALSPSPTNNDLSASTNGLDRNRENLGEARLHGSEAEVSSLIGESKREKPIFPSFERKNNIEQDKGTTRPTDDAHPSQEITDVKNSSGEWNDSGVNLDNSQNDSLQRKDSDENIAPSRKQNNSRDGDGKKSVDSGEPPQKQKTTSRGWVIVREYEC